MLAERADKILRQLLSLIDVAADIADPALLFGIRLRLDVLLIVGIGHRLNLIEHDRFRDVAQEHPVRSHVDYVENLKRNIGIRVLRKISDAVHRHIEMVVACELVDVPSGLESEMAELLERSLLVEDADIHHAGLC